MRHFVPAFVALSCLGLFLPVGCAVSGNSSLGLFEAHGDIGDVGVPGAVRYDAGTQSYTVTGGGENMWFDTDALHFAWKRMAGDVTLAADIRWIGTGGNAHRKACLLIRQSLDPNAAYADAVIHGDGLTSLQYRQAPGETTREIQANVSGPRRLRIEKQGDFVSMSITAEGEPLYAAGGSFKIRFAEPFYVGLGVCAHDNAVSEQAVFSNVEITTGQPKAAGEPVLESTLEIVPIASGDRRVVYHTRDHIEAPNWSRDGTHLLFNSGGRLYRIAVAGGTPELVDTGFATRCNNDHGFSPDGTRLAISDQSQEGGKSLIYVLPAAGGTPRRVTQLGPSYWHGWSPDGQTLAYCAEREGEYDVYTIPVAGGQETRLTTAKGLDDGPDYSPDGRYIYFNSVRTGTMQIWRMNADGSDQQQVTFDEYNDWFAHPSPDGRWLVFVSYEKDVEGHPANKDVMLRLMPAAGGQGTINVPSWSPDSRNIAFVSYRLTQP